MSNDTMTWPCAIDDATRALIVDFADRAGQRCVARVARAATTCEEWDRAWKTEADFLAWLRSVVRDAARVHLHAVTAEHAATAARMVAVVLA